MTINRFVDLLCTLAVAGLALNTATSASAEPVNFKQTHYFKLFGREDADAAGERAGYEAENRAYPAAAVEPSVRDRAAADSDRLERRGWGHRGAWELVGPFLGRVPAEVTYTGHASIVSGRVTSLAISPRCAPSHCTLALGAAGGGV
jgi:hypothetical protein